MKRLSLLLLILLLFLTGCECVGGFGRDLQQAGNWVERQAERSKR